MVFHFCASYFSFFKILLCLFRRIYRRRQPVSESASRWQHQSQSESFEGIQSQRTCLANEQCKTEAPSGAVSRIRQQKAGKYWELQGLNLFCFRLTRAANEKFWKMSDILYSLARLTEREMGTLVAVLNLRHISMATIWNSLVNFYICWQAIDWLRHSNIILLIIPIQIIRFFDHLYHSYFDPPWSFIYAGLFIIEIQ